MNASPSTPRLKLAFAIAAAAAMNACYTTANTVSLTPLKTKYPVSASGQYLTNDGALVTEDDYEIIESFEFQKEIAAPRHEQKESRLELEPELDRVLAQHSGDAITQLSISATQYDEGSHASAASWKVLGWSFGITGATLMLVGASSDDTGTSLLTIGGVFLGMGVASYLLSYTANDPATWQLAVTGQVVRRSSGAPSTSAAKPEASLSSLMLPEPSWATAPAPNWAVAVPPGYRPLRALAARP